MIGHTIKKQQRPAALKKRIDKLKIQLKELEDLLVATPDPPPPPPSQPEEDEEA